MFALALLYYLLTYYYRMNIMNVSYEITPPMVEDMNNNHTFIPEYILELRMQAAIDRFASFDEYMDIPGFGEDMREEEPDDITVTYDDEKYGFHKCGEIAGCYDYSEFYESETIIPEHEDYFLPEEEEENDYDYHNDPEYWEEMRYERMVDRMQEMNLD